MKLDLNVHLLALSALHESKAEEIKHRVRIMDIRADVSALAELESAHRTVARLIREHLMDGERPVCESCTDEDGRI
jgi:hypothetical protein